MRFAYPAYGPTSTNGGIAPDALRLSGLRPTAFRLTVVQFWSVKLLSGCFSGANGALL